MRWLSNSTHAVPQFVITGSSVLVLVLALSACDVTKSPTAPEMAREPHQGQPTNYQANGLTAAARGGQPKAYVCHSEGNGDYHLIRVAQSALAAHIAHGDGQPGGAVPNMPNFIFDDECNPAAVIVCPCFDLQAVQSLFPVGQPSGTYQCGDSGPEGSTQIIDPGAWAATFHPAITANLNGQCVFNPIAGATNGIGEEGHLACREILLEWQGEPGVCF